MRNLLLFITIIIIIITIIIITPGIKTKKDGKTLDSPSSWAPTGDAPDSPGVWETHMEVVQTPQRSVPSTSPQAFDTGPS